ncbi:hypothetical protein CMO89_04220 [Candidatus Woesearchaeota archaeon]|nr:hypothetical protein [Candidatus Woesearchaeota archaeon]|tara:strand:- start:9243 stop:11582 length:2340 start_codon:yes stop_codon:yes gene_type:complete
MQKILNRIKSNKESIFLVGILLLMTVLFFLSFLRLDYFYWGDGVGFYMPRVENLKQSIFEYKDFWPLWSPYFFAGHPFLFKHIIGVDSITGVILLLTGSPSYAVKLSYVLDIFLSGVAMYFLILYITKKTKPAFISALVYMFNGWVIGRFQMGHLNTLNGYVFMPLVILFMIKTLKSKDWLKYSIITAILLGLQLRVGPDLKATLWTVFIFGVYILVYLIGKNLQKKIVKAMLVSAVISIIFLGLSLQRVLPGKEFLDMSGKERRPWEVASGRKIAPKDFFSSLVQPMEGFFEARKPGGAYHLGIIAFLLAAFGVYKGLKSRYTLFFTSIIIISLFLVSGSFLFYLLWRYVPGFSSFRYLTRTLIIYVFGGSALAGIGTHYLLANIKRKQGKKAEYILFGIISALVILNLMVFGYSPYRATKMQDVNQVLSSNHVLQDISKEIRDENFRIHSYETIGIDYGTEFFTVPLRLENIYGYDTMWLPEYLNVYLSVANEQPAKFWGILNQKYLTSRQPLNLSGFEFVRKYEECEICFPEIDKIQKAYGPYLYENKQYLPRAFILNNGILVIGEKESATKVIYSLMLNKNFNPESTIIVRGKERVNDYGIQELKRFNALVLTQGSVDMNSAYILEQFKKSGGMLLPDITEGEDTVPGESVDAMFISLGKDKLLKVDDKNIMPESFEKKAVKLGRHKGTKGFLVLSEKYSMFPGWTAKSGGKIKNIYNVDGVISAVYLEGDEENITFEFKPGSYRTGFAITIITLLFVIIYFGFKVSKGFHIKKS